MKVQALILFGRQNEDRHLHTTALTINLDVFHCVPGTDEKGKIEQRDYEATTNDKDGSWWVLKDTSNPAFKFLVVLRDNRRFYGSSERNEFGIYDEGVYPDQFWKLLGDDDGSGSLRIICFEGERELNCSSAGFSLIDGPGHRGPDSHFQFLWESGKVVSVKFLEKQAHFQPRTPKQIGSRTVRNNSSVPQQESYQVKFTESTNHTWKYEGGFAISANMELSFTAGIPVIASAQGKISFGAETHHTWTNEQTTTACEEMTFTVPVVVPAYTEVTSTTLIKVDEMEVPYEMEIAFPNCGQKFVSRGKWVGVKTHNSYTTVEEKSIK